MCLEKVKHSYGQQIDFIVINYVMEANVLHMEGSMANVLLLALNIDL